MTDGKSGNEHFHRRVLEGKAGLFAIFTTVVISIGGLVEIVPMFTTAAGPERPDWASPYTPLEVAGRDIYIREGCNVCHSQMVRPMRAELLRYGEWTRAGEYRYDHPFLLGSRRIGPDLNRVGGKYADGWHYEHMRDARSMTAGSVMPNYAWLLDRRIDPGDVRASLRALSAVGVPYTDADLDGVAASLAVQAGGIVARLSQVNIHTDPDLEIIALIAYLQRLGQDGRRAIEAGLTARSGSP